jgi:hypothetical protein
MDLDNAIDLLTIISIATGALAVVLFIVLKVVATKKRK